VVRVTKQAGPYPNMPRVRNQWGYNSFADQQGAEETARWMGRQDTCWYIWRLADGSFDFSAIPDPTTLGHPAELVNTITV